MSYKELIDDKEFENNKEFIRYKRIYDELLRECEELKMLGDEIDPLKYDFDSKVTRINHLKDKLNQYHYNLLNEL